MAPDAASDPLVLPAVLDLAAAGPLLAAFQSRLGAPLEVDAGEVRRLGGQCLQVLIAARRRWDADGAAFAVTRASPAFAEAAALFGAQAALALDPADATGPGDPDLDSLERAA